MTVIAQTIIMSINIIVFFYFLLLLWEYLIGLLFEKISIHHIAISFNVVNILLFKYIFLDYFRFKYNELDLKTCNVELFLL